MPCPRRPCRESIIRQLATLKSKAPIGDQWVHEIKFDGYRLQIHLQKGKVTVYTRNGHDWTSRFRSLLTRLIFRRSAPFSMAKWWSSTTVKQILPSCRLTWPATSNGEWYFTRSNLLFLDGFDLRKSPQIELKRVLKMLFDETNLKSPILYSEHILSTATRFSPPRASSAGKGLFPRTPKRPIAQTVTKVG